MPDRWPAAMLLSTAAEYMDCSVDQVERLVRAGCLGCIQYNERGDRRILREEIDAFLESRRKERVLSQKSA
jgi:excisionase family DNA binding protein